MRIAALYDIHGNLPALEAVLDEVRSSRVDLVVVGGDVLPGPMPRETLACLQAVDLPIRFLKGNGDRAVVELRKSGRTSALPEQAMEAVSWVAQQLEPDQVRIVAGWPATVRVDVERLGGVLFCHATPRNDTEIFTRITPSDRLRAAFADADAELVVCGHTHMQFDRKLDQIRVVNAGSVGMPFGEPGSYWLLLTPEIELRRTMYDLQRAAERISRTEYPHASQFASEHVLHPPSEAQMLDVFSRRELS